MQTNNINPVLNEAIIAKFNSISLDIKTYLNANYNLAKELDLHNTSINQFITDYELETIIDIRKSIKKLVQKFNERSSNNTIAINNENISE